jgi:hypothetical protein
MHMRSQREETVRGSGEPSTAGSRVGPKGLGTVVPTQVLNPVCRVLVPLRPVNPAVTALLLPPSLFEVDYLTVERAKIYVGWSRHWVVAWLWFLS